MARAVAASVRPMIQRFLRHRERPSAPISSSSIAGETPGLAIDDTLACITHSTHHSHRYRHGHCKLFGHYNLATTSHLRLQTIKVASALNNDQKNGLPAQSLN